MTPGFPPLRILFIAATPQTAPRLLKETNASRVTSLEHTTSVPDASALTSRAIDAIVLDTGRPDGFDLTALDTLRGAAGDRIPIVILANDGDEEMVHEAMQRGAQDYLMTDRVNIDLLVRSVRYARERLEWRRESRRQEAERLQDKQ